MRVEAGLGSQAAKVESIAAAGIEHDVARRCSDGLRDGVQQWRCHAAVVQSPPPCYGGHRVARVPGSALLRLKQVDVSAPRNVERMSTWTYQSPLLPRQRQVA